MNSFLLLLLLVAIALASPSLNYKNERRARSDRSERSEKRSIPQPVPSQGNQRLLVLAVEYPNQRGKYTGAQWKTGMFADFSSYYAAQSYNKLLYTVDVVTVDSTGKPVINDPASTSYIPLAYNVSRYANKAYGFDFNSGSPWNLRKIVADAAMYLDSKNFDWTPYVQNKTYTGLDAKKTVQNVLIMSAGTDYRYASSEDAASNYLLSTSYFGVGYKVVSSGATLDSFTFCNEHTQQVGSTPLTMAYLGQCAHEFGHGLGLPDMYDLTGRATGVGYFDLLGYGLYAGSDDGATPTGWGAFTKDAIGWSEPTIIWNQTTTVQLGPASQSASNFLKIYTNESKTSFYLVENRQGLDKWDKNFQAEYGNGIVIWRVDYDDVNKYTRYNSINSYPNSAYPYCPPTPSAVVMEADGKQDMSTKSPILHFGSSADLWQVGKQYVTPENVSIAVQALTGQVYTITVSYTGAVFFPNSIGSSGYVLYSSPILLLMLVAYILF